MNLNFRQQSVGETVYLVLDMEDGSEIDSFAINMMARNRMTNIVQTQVIQINEKRQIQFNITGLVKLNSQIARPRPKKEVLPVLNSILNAFEEADAYMLDMGHLLLEWEYIYLDGQGNCMFLYLPFTYISSKDKIVFLQEAVSRIQPDYQEKDPYLFDILNAFSRGAIRKLSDFREAIKKSAGISHAGYKEEEKRKPEIEMQGQSPAANAWGIPEKENLTARAAEKETDNQNDGKTEKKTEKKISGGSKIPIINIPGREPGAKTVSLKPQKETDKKEKKKAKGFFGRKENGKQENGKQGSFLIPGKKKEEKPAALEEGRNKAADDRFSGENGREDWQNSMYEGYENTVIMQEPAAVHREMENTVMLEPPIYSRPMSAGLIRRQDGRRYLIERDRVMIGSGTAADICIYNNNAVSRNHAVISCMNGSYFIEDNQSKNGSFINGRRLQPGIREPLYDGMTVRFANEDFEFFKE